MRRGFDKYFARNRCLQKMGFATYQDYLNSDLWAGLRAVVLAEQPLCRCCNNSSQVVHHASYKEKVLRKGGTALVALCWKCHELIEVDQEGDKDPYYKSLTKLLCLLTDNKEYELATELARMNGRKYVRSVYCHGFVVAMQMVRKRGQAGKKKYGMG